MNKVEKTLSYETRDYMISSCKLCLYFLSYDAKVVRLVIISKYLRYLIKNRSYSCVRITPVDKFVLEGFIQLLHPTICIGLRYIVVAPICLLLVQVDLVANLVEHSILLHMIVFHRGSIVLR